MERILERYDRYSTTDGQLVATDSISQGSWILEHAKLKAKIEVLQKNQRHYMGEDLESLSLKELQNLENQLDSALKHLRSKKNQIMFESISQLQKTDKALQDKNHMMSKKIYSFNYSKNNTSRLSLIRTSNSRNFRAHYFNSDVFQAVGNSGDVEGTSQQQNQTNTMIPAWMLT
ncbi:hypothetical protein DCAR_0416934 [Daucus carota subsp. sativus]|uniref:K-box domain-containing protein n=1 Tax=Daucus carota subsp. sativus TaxID=79200 RepID=A0AAF0WZU5_DAUCS|nr:hypothetical protein DCAR_0416934 [Daucus carota subsp. sativus]